MSSHRLIERVKKQTEGIQTGILENQIANTFLFPAYVVGQLFSNDGISFQELYSQNVLGYKRLLKIVDNHGGSLPVKIRNSYLCAPCGIAKLCAYQVRKYFGGEK